jgi:hypothetical protein
LFECSWPALPLPGRSLQDAREAAEATPIPLEASAPVLEPPPPLQSACIECGDPLPAKTGPGRRPTRCERCRRSKHNGHDPKPLADLKERPMREQSYEAEWLAEQLKPPKMPWDT